MAEETPDIIYGCMLEGLHISGYAFERFSGNLEYLLTGDRWREVGDGRHKDINSFLRSFDLSPYNLQDKRPEIIRMIKERQPEASQRAIAETLGVSNATISRDLAAVTNVTPEVEIPSVGRPLDVTNVTPPIETPPLPTGKYRVIYADPPWKYSDANLQKYGHAKFHYQTMSIDELCDMDIRNISESNAVLFLWVTSPMLEDSFKVIKAWGFEYKTSFVWDKVRHNYGHYNSVRHELLLICTKGSCTPDDNKLFDSVIDIEGVITKERGEHSEKPEYFREMIDTLYPYGTRIELFARRQAEGWDAFGHEATSRKASL